MANDKPSADVVADEIRKLYTFKTFSDTKEILYYHKNSGLYLKNAHTLIEAETEKWMVRYGYGDAVSRGFVNEVIGHIKRNTFVNRDKFNSEPNLLVVQNGVLNIETGEINPPSSSYLFTIGLPITFDPQATCPAIAKFFSEIVIEENVPLLYEIIGWTLDKYSKFSEYSGINRGRCQR